MSKVSRLWHQENLLASKVYYSHGASRLSRRFHALAADSELWKRQYYSRWVFPRTRLLKCSRHPTELSRALYSPKVSKWLGHGHLTERENDTNWQKKYRLKHNWSKGVCRVREVAVSHPPSPAVLVKLFAGIVFTADRGHGLRAWLSKQPETCFAGTQFPGCSADPTSLSAGRGPGPYETQICVGFGDGHFQVFGFNETNSTFALRCSSTIAPRASITGIASSPPYIMLVSDHKTMSLYEIPSEAISKAGEAKPPAKVTTLEANNILAPMSLYLRNSGCELIASVAYSFYHIGCGWCIGIQEIHLSSEGTPSRSRLVTTIDSFWDEYASQTSSCYRGPRRIKTPNFSPKTHLRPFSHGYSVRHNEPPTSLSYSHPYLITSHSDNTLTMYLVVSSADDLMIKGARRLWGHTSSVSTVHVSDRGKAVSVSTKGDEIRIWELETMIGSGNAPGRCLREENSIQVSPERRTSVSSLEMRNTPQVVRWSLQHLLSDQSEAKAETVNKQDWVGFDEEQVILLRHQGRGTQLLECYDFT